MVFFACLVFVFLLLFYRLRCMLAYIGLRPLLLSPKACYARYTSGLRSSFVFISGYALACRHAKQGRQATDCFASPTACCHAKQGMQRSKNASQAEGDKSMASPPAKRSKNAIRRLI
jgi:hypothetical protein